MIKPSDPRQLVMDLLPRSVCAVKVAAVLADDHGIFSWGWNSAGQGFGEHAEAAAVRRSNKKRLEGATIYVAGVRDRNGRPVNSKPCPACERLVRKWDLTVVYRGADGEWFDA